jgi:membrane protein implicated in regulation of membrane protease activity
MTIGFVVIAIYAIAVIALVTRFSGSKKKPKRITGRGGDFE